MKTRLKYQALENLKDGLRSTDRTYIYHCYNHYMCPIGFEMTPNKPVDAYALNKDIAEFDTWIIIGELGVRPQGPQTSQSLAQHCTTPNHTTLFYTIHYYTIQHTATYYITITITITNYNYHYY